MTVYVNNITINTGEYFSRDFYLDNIDGTPLNLVGYAASSYIRKHPESLNPTAKFNVGFIDRANGRIRVSLASTITAEIKPGRYVYDVLFTDNTTKKSIVIEGNVLATEDISTGCIKTQYLYKYGAIETDSQIVGAGAVTPSTTIVATNIDSISDYGVVVFGYMDRCGNMTQLLSNLNNSEYLNKINSYLNNGGVVWYRHEWGSACGNQTQSNQILALLGTSIRVQNIQSVASTTTRITSSTLFPQTLNHSATNSLNYGIPLYETSANGYVTVAYEKVGNGVIFVNADVNGSFQSPSDELYTAIRDLVTSGTYSYTVSTPNWTP